ncbi:hypothetical protein ACGF3J_35750 [Streptomyces sp. NPDC048171]|uniref:hypothetical protein n=1 Tax=unclassified Streptomyces TaxID=2593676 RepID=UPI0019284D40
MAKSFGGTYVEFASDASGPVKPALYKRRGPARGVGVPEDGGGAHRIVPGAATGAFTGPDGFAREPAPVTSASA